MKATELRAGLEVLVLERGRRTRLADAETYRATILCEETFASSCGGFGELTMVDGPDCVSYEVYGALSTTGNRVALLVEDGRGGVRTEVVLNSRILGPVKPAEARVAAAKRKWAEQGRALRKALVERAKLERRLTSVLRGPDSTRVTWRSGTSTVFVTTRSRSSSGRSSWRRSSRCSRRLATARWMTRDPLSAAREADSW